jgi:hypothetical protein
MRLHNCLAVVFSVALVAGRAAPATGQTFEWAKQAGGSCGPPCNGAFHQGSAIAVDAGGNCVVTSHITGTAVFGRGELNEVTLVSGGTDLYVAKFDRAGSLLWVRQAFGGDIQGRAVALDASGNSYVAGAFRFGARFRAHRCPDLFLASTICSSRNTIRREIFSGPGREAPTSFPAFQVPG